MRERGEGPVHVVANVLRRGVSTTTGRGVECARYTLHEGHTHELLSSLCKVRLQRRRPLGCHIVILMKPQIHFKINNTRGDPQRTAVYD